MSSTDTTIVDARPEIGFFERYLTVWVVLCIVGGILVGQVLPQFFQAIGRMEVAHVNLPVGVLIWVMIIPMLVKIDFGAMTQVLVDVLQWRGALLALAGLNLAIAYPSMFSQLAAMLRAKTIRVTRKAALKAINAAATSRALRTPTFWALAVCFTAYYATFAALTFDLVPLMAERRVLPALILTTMAVIGPVQVLARVLWFTVGRNVRPSIVGVVVTTTSSASVLVLMCADTSPAMLILFAVIYGGANGMMTILRATIVQDVMWKEDYGAVSGLLSMPSNIAKGIAPISAAAIWTIDGNYAPVEWTVLLVSLVSAIAFFFRDTSRLGEKYWRASGPFRVSKSRPYKKGKRR